MPASRSPTRRSPAPLPAASSRRCCGFWLPWLAAPLWMLFPLLGCLLAAELRRAALPPPQTSAGATAANRRLPVVPVVRLVTADAEAVARSRGTN